MTNDLNFALPRLGKLDGKIWSYDLQYSNNWQYIAIKYPVTVRHTLVKRASLLKVLLIVQTPARPNHQIRYILAVTAAATLQIIVF